MYCKWLRVKYNFLKVKLYTYKKIYKPCNEVGSHRKMVRYFSRVIKVFDVLDAQERVLKQINFELQRQKDLILMKVIGQ